MIRFRDIVSDEIWFLKDMIYEAIFVPEGDRRPARSILDSPGLIRYHKDWGKHLDLAILAEEDGVLSGLIWGRLFEVSEPGYGFFSELTPEISLAVITNQRGKGIGGCLLDNIARR